MRVNNWISFVSIMASIAIGVAIATLITEIDLIEPGWCNARANCLREWIGALSGWAAAMAAGATIFWFRHQFQREQLLRNDDKREITTNAMNMIAIDLAETAYRLKRMQNSYDSGPKLSGISLRLIPAIAGPLPLLARALQAHTTEMYRIESSMKGEGRPPPTIHEVKQAEFRTRVLAECFIVASSSTDDLQTPIISPSALETRKRSSGLSKFEYDYLAILNIG